MFIGNEVSIRLMLRLREPSAEKKEMARDHPAVMQEETQLSRLVGRYRVADADRKLGVHLMAGELSVERNGKLLRMIPIGETRYRLQDFAAFVSFKQVGGHLQLLFERPGREAQVFLALE